MLRINSSAETLLNQLKVVSSSFELRAVSLREKGISLAMPLGD